MPPITTVAKPKEKELFDFDKNQEVADFLLEHYDIKISIQYPSKRYIRCKDKYREHIEPNFNEISLHLASDGKNVGDATLRKILKSPYYIPHCDPIREYFDSIRGTWNGISHIDILCNHITPRDFDDQPEGYYRERTNKLIRKWLVACVAQWIGGIPNDVILGWVQAVGGAGKSGIAEWLLPDVLSDFFRHASDDDKKFNVEDAYAAFMLLNYDELAGIRKSSINTIKQCQSLKEIFIKMRGEEFPTKKNRLACGMLSTNFNEENGGFIQPWYGSDTRKFGLVEITAINWEAYTKEVDKNQMFAEMITLYESSSFDYQFDKPDYLDFNNYNARYKFETDAMRVIQLWVAKPEIGEEGEKMNSTEILQRLVREKRITGENLNKITSQKIGAALTSMGFEGVSYRSKGGKTPLKGYHVKFLE